MLNDENERFKKEVSYPAEGRTFLRTLGAQRASVRSFVRQKGTGFQNGSSLRNRMKLNMCTYLEHECISITTLKTDFDYKRPFTQCFASTILLSNIDPSMKLH